MNTNENIETRRSIKHFDPEHVMSEADLQELLRLTQLAPSSFNMQNYRILAVRDAEQKKKLREAAWDQAQVSDASVLFIMCADITSHREDPATYWSHAPQEVQDILGPMMKPFYEGKDQLIRDEAVRSYSLAGMTLMLAARELGYDSCSVIGFAPEAVSKIINLPENYILGFMIPVGKQAQPAWDRGERLGAAKVVSHDTF